MGCKIFNPYIPLFPANAGISGGCALPPEAPACAGVSGEGAYLGAMRMPPSSLRHWALK